MRLRKQNHRTIINRSEQFMSLKISDIGDGKISDIERG